MPLNKKWVSISSKIGKKGGEKDDGSREAREER